MEGIGYTCTDIVVTARPINASGTQFMFDINLVGYTFDMGDMVFDDEPTLSDTQSRQSDIPDRDDYWKIPKASKFDYGDRDWYNPMNVATFFDNVVIDLVNPIIDMLNGPLVSSQVGYHEGADAWRDYEMGAAKGLVNAPIDFIRNSYNYATNTRVSQQISDLGRDLSNPHSWETGVAMGVGLYYGGRTSGTVPKATLPKVNSSLGVRKMMDVGHKTIFKSLLERYNLSLDKRYFSGFQFYHKPTNTPYFRIQLHSHSIRPKTGNNLKYPHYNIEIEYIPYTTIKAKNRHLIFNRKYQINEINKRVNIIQNYIKNRAWRQE